MIATVKAWFAAAKIWLFAGLAALSAILYALLQREKASRAEAEKNGLEKARETEQKATEAMTKGLENESNTNVKPDRSHFERL